jgi:hypothetical protein
VKAMALVPFGYSLITRFNTARDFLYLVATQWIPGIWLVHRLGAVDLAAAAALYAAGYLAFIALYEIGYLVNDTWDARRQTDARRRFDHAIGPGYAVAFVAIRLAVWAIVGAALGRLGDPDWLMLSAALAAAFAIHNFLSQNHLRIASFTQLTLLRFAVPVLFGLGSGQFLLVLFVCTLFYLSFRLLAYLDSKGFLTMPERKAAGFGLLQIVLLFPLVALSTVVTGEPVILELFVYFTLLYGLYALRPRWGL